MGAEDETTRSTAEATLAGPGSRQVAERTADYLRVVAEPSRILLLSALDTGEASVQELADRIGASHQRTSKHLSILRTAGMVERRRQGPEARYSLIDWTGRWVVEQVSRSLDADRHPGA